MTNSTDTAEGCDILTCVNLLLLGRPPWLLGKKFKSFFTCCCFGTLYAVWFALYVLSSAIKIRMEYTLCGVNSIRFVTMAHDVFSSACVCYLILYAFGNTADQSNRLCAEFRIKNVKSLLRAVLMFGPAFLILLLNLSWQATAFSSTVDLIAATLYHTFSLLIWNGLWIYTCVRIHMEYGNLQRVGVDTNLNIVDTLNNEIGKYLFLLFAKTVFDAISSLSFYSIQDSPLPQVLLLHETGVVIYGLFFCACVSELSSRMSNRIRNAFLNQASFVCCKPMASDEAGIVFQSIIQVSGSIAWTPPLLNALLPRGLDAFGVFTVNRSFFATMCGTTLTFLLILVQLSPDVQRTMRMNS